MSRRKILSIEAIRGFAAIYVVLDHIIFLYQPYIFCPEYKHIMKALFGLGHPAVLLFFIVSGFSIHYSSSNLAHNRKSICEYFYKRIRRIYPLFVFSLLLAIGVLCILRLDVEIKQIVLSFLFLTDIFFGSICEPIFTNGPIWSLSYEIPYYLLYPLLHWGIKKYGMKRMLFLSVLISFCAGLFTILNGPNHLCNIVQLYWVWVIGAYFADLILKKKQITVRYMFGLLIFFAGLMFTVEEYKYAVVQDWAWSGFFSLIFLSFFAKSNKINTYKQKIFNLLIGLSGIGICFLLSFSNIVYRVLPVRFILAGLILVLFILLFVPFNHFRFFLRKILNPFLYFGNFSYAVYIFHWPVMIFFTNVFKSEIQTNILSMMLFIVANIAIVMLLSWYMEIKVQPIVVKALNKAYYRNASCSRK